MKYVYVAGPYTIGDPVINVRRAVKMADDLMARGFVPFVPHLSHFWHLVFPHKYDEWLRWCRAWIDRCDCLLVIEGESFGVQEEVKHAESRDIPVFYSLNDLINAATKT